jgi:hypothetical protein
VIALGLVLLQLAAGQQQPAPRLTDPGAVLIAVRVQPDTVTVGDRFNVFVRVRAPAGATIEFPAGPDSGTVELVTSVAITEPRADSLWLEQTAGYRLAAWDIDAQPLGMGDVIVRLAGAERRMSLANRTIFVRSVLPADTSLHVPKPARAAFGFGIPGWVWWLLAALLALLLALVAWWLWRKYRRREAALPPFQAAEREFARVEAMRLPEKGEGARHVALMTDVLRDYLAARVNEVHGSQTSRELLRAAAESPDARWDPVVRSRAEKLLARADLAKFAAVSIESGEAVTLGTVARELVRETERRITDEAQRAAA